MVQKRGGKRLMISDLERKLMFTFLAISMAFVSAPQTGHGSQGEPPSLEGLWSYTGIAPRGRSEMPLTGLFLFRDGRFVQQAINDGEPFDEQGGQAHAGTYQPAGTGFTMVAEQAIGVSPGRTPPVSVRRNTEHEIDVQFAGNALTMTFGSGTIQKFERIGDGDGEVFHLHDGSLALVDGHFLLVAVRDDKVVAGSGKFEKKGDSITFQVMTWFSVLGEKVTYARDTTIEASFDGEALKLGDGTRFPVKK
jgi:hypothetical protein